MPDLEAGFEKVPRSGADWARREGLRAKIAFAGVRAPTITRRLIVIANTAPARLIRPNWTLDGSRETARRAS